MADNREYVNTGIDNKVVKAPTSATIPAQNIQTTIAPAPEVTAPTETMTPRQWATEWYLNLWGGKIVNKSSQQYKALVWAWYDDNKIISMYNAKQQVKTPTQPIVQAEVKAPEVVKPETPVKTEQTTAIVTPMPVDRYKDDSEARQQEIVNNLNQYKQANPGLFADKELFKRSFSYDNRSDLQKQILDNWYWNNVEKINQTSALSRQPISSIVDQYINGTLSDTDISNIKNIDPVRYGDIQAAIDQWKKNEEYKKLLYGDDAKKDENKWLNDILAKATSLLESKADTSMYEDYKNQLNAPEITTLKDDLSAKEGAIKEIDNEINSTKSELEKKFKGSGISQGQINALIQDQTQLLQNRKNTLSIEYQTLADKYSNKISTIKDTLEITEKENAQKLAQEQSQFQKLGFIYNIYSDQQKRNDALKAADVAYQRDIEKMQKQFEQNKEMTKYQDQVQNGDINSTDPFMVNKAIEKNVDSLMKQFDGLILSSKDKLVERVKEGMKSGKSYSAVLGEIMTDIRNKPEYKSWQANKLGIDNKPYSLWGWLIAVQWSNWQYNVMTDQQFKDSYNIPNDKVQAIQKSINDERALKWASQYDDPDTVQKIRAEWLGKNCGVQCAWYTNILASKLWLDIKSWSTLQDKITSMSNPAVYSPVPVIGGFVTLDTWAKLADGTPAGHTWYVTEIDTKNGRIKVLNSNRNGTATNPNTTVTEDWFDLNKVKASTIAAWKWNPASASNTTAAPLTDDQRTLFTSQTNAFNNNQVVKSFEAAAQQYQNIQSSLENPSWPGDMAAIYQFMKSLDPSSTVRESEFNSAAATAGIKGTLQNWASRIENGENLTPEQRNQFAKLAKTYVQNYASAYNRYYDNMAKVLKFNGISDAYLPARASDAIMSTQYNMNSNIPQTWQWSTLDTTSLFNNMPNMTWFSRQG